MKQAKVLEAVINQLPIMGKFTFVTDFDEDFEGLKDMYSIPPEINMFAIVHRIDEIIETLTGEDFETAGERMLANDYEGYLVPNEYKGFIAYVLDEM